MGFIVLLTALLGASFAVHALLQHDLKIGAFESHIVINYCFNYFFTIAFFIVLLVYERRKSDLLGFVFLAASTIKLILFLFILYPNIKEVTGFRSVEFTSFFVPYGISVVIEILYMLRILNSKSFV